MLPITDITSFTLLDFPNCTSCIIWFAGCNMKCQYCHNTELLGKQQSYINEEQVLNFLKNRRGLLDGVVFSGGECTLSGLEFINFVEKVKQLGFKTKIDTNGLNFLVVKHLIGNKLLDFVALDYKSTDEKFINITNNDNYSIFRETLTYLINENNKNIINLEIRTTVHIDLLNEDDINLIIKDLEQLGYKGNYYIQNFRNDNKQTLYNLAKPTREFCKAKLITSDLIKINFRNFF